MTHTNEDSTLTPPVPPPSRRSAKVIAVAEYDRPDQNTTGYLWHQMTTHLQAAGLPVQLISYTRDMSSRVRSSVALRALLKLFVSLRLAMKVAMSARRGDVVLSVTTPEILLPMLALLKQILGFKLCVLMHDVFPENLVPAGVLKQSDRRYKLLVAIYRRTQRCFDAMIVIGRDMQKLVDASGQPGRSIVAHNWIDRDTVIPLDRDASGLVESLGWQDHVIFQFYGNMGRLQGIDGLLRALARVRASNAAFLFIGSGVMQGEVEEFCAGQTRRYYVRSQEGYDRNALHAACDVALICLKPGMFGLGVPSKAYYNLAADRPLLAIMDNDSEIALMIKDHGVGWACPADDPDKIAAEIDAICAAPIGISAGHCRRLMETEYSAEKSLGRVTRQIREMLECER